MKRKLFTSVLAGVLVVSGILIPNYDSADAQSLNEIRAKKAENEEKKRKKQSELSNVKSEKAEVQKQIDQINKEMTVTTEKIVNNESKITKNNEKIAQLEVEIQEAEIRIAERDALLKERVRSMHVNGGAISYIEVLLGAKSFGDFLDRVLALNVIAEQDRTIIEEQKVDKRLLEENKAEVEKINEEIKKEQEELKQLKEELDAKYEERERLLGEITEKEEHLHAEYGELENIDNVLAAQEAAFKEQNAIKKTSSSYNDSSPSGGNSGMFIRPTTGPKTSDYGQRWGRLHAGVDIANGKGTPIYAAASGKVITAGWMNGYGNTIMISHPNGYTTLYAHLNSISVSVGQQVSQGQRIGGMGNTGNVKAGPGGDGTHLHFEIHPGGYKNPQDPCRWITC